MTEEILVIKHGALGDFVMMAGRMGMIRARHPAARITLMTQAFLVGFAKGLGYFDDFVVDNRGYGVGDWWRIVKRTLADRRWDRIYDLQSSNRTLCRYAPLARFLTRHPMRWGRITRGKSGFDFHNTPAKWPFTWRRGTHERVEMDFPPPDLSHCRGEHAHWDLLPERYVLLIPGCSAGNDRKRWPSARYRAVSEEAARLGYRSVVMGTPAESAEIAAICDGNPAAVDFMGKSSIADIPDLARGAALVVGNDTGPSHMARLAGARIVMLFRDYDYGRAAAVASNVVNLHAPEIAGIPLEEVLAAVRAQLAPAGGEAARA